MSSLLIKTCWVGIRQVICNKDWSASFLTTDLNWVTLVCSSVQICPSSSSKKTVRPKGVRARSKVVHAFWLWTVRRWARDDRCLKGQIIRSSSLAQSHRRWIATQDPAASIDLTSAAPCSAAALPISMSLCKLRKGQAVWTCTDASTASLRTRNHTSQWPQSHLQAQFWCTITWAVQDTMQACCWVTRLQEGTSIFAASRRTPNVKTRVASSQKISKNKAQTSWLRRKFLCLLSWPR